jgi:predicted permease
MVLTLAIGIGANTALFSVVDGLLLRPLPYPDSDRLITVWSRSPKDEPGNLSPADFVDYRDRNRVFNHLSGIAQAEFNVTVRGAAERLAGFRTSAGFFEALGVKPALGRTISADDDHPGAAPVAVLGYFAWQRRFGGDPRIIGKTVTVNGGTCTIIGVMPASFRFAFAPEMWMPFPLDPASGSREDRYLAVFGKLKPGVSLAQARTQMEGIARNLAQAYPASLKDWSVQLTTWREQIIGPLSRHQDILLLFGAVGCVLLIACVNLANLLLAKAAARERELAVRASLGAGRGRLIAQVLTEGVLLALTGGAAGALFA